MNSLFMLHLAHLLKDESLQAQVDINLKKMALGGIYDHLGGGFARYSVDAYWKVPHFEKMLYDNGQLLSLYSEAYLQHPQPLYQRIIEETMDFVTRELRSEEGGFYSSLDADSEGEEGKFYVWDYAELEELLGEDLKPLADYYNLQPQGNWEGNNVLFALESPEEFAERWKLDQEQFLRQLTQAKGMLFKKRESRTRPGLDGKILASWNGLMLKGVVDAYRALGKEAYLQLAKQHATFLMEKLYEPGQLYRNYKAGRHSIPAFLDDYAQVIRGLLGLYQVSFEEDWLLYADRLMAEAIDHFDDPETGLFFYTSIHGESLIRRKIERQDDVIPSSNSVMAHNLLDLGLLLDRAAYRDRAKAMLEVMLHDLTQLPAWHSHWGQFLLKLHFSYAEVAICGPEAASFRLELDKSFGMRLYAGTQTESNLPLLKSRSKPDQTLIYVCEDYTCQLPTNLVEEARKILHSLEDGS